MNEKKYWCPEGINAGADMSRVKQKTLRQKVLISAWVTAYSGLLFAFRVAKSIEKQPSKKREGVERDPDKAVEKNVRA